jgi:transposase
MTMSSVAYTITSEKVGESLKNFKLLDNWLVIADRAYGTKTGIVCCLDQKANFILRIKHGAFIIYNEQGEEIDLLTQLTDVDDTSALDLDVWVKLPKIGMTKMRICAMKIPEDKIAQIEHKDVRKASKRQHKVSKEALELHKYVIVITSLHKDITAEEILATYRLRWQVELYFKRLKSIMDFGNVPLKREENIFAWLNGKFLIALLLEKMLSEIVFPPPE